MSLSFGAATTDYVNFGTGSGIANLDPFTYLTWCYPTTLTDLRRIWQKGVTTTLKRFMISGTAGEVNVRVARATADTIYTTNSAPLVLNAWNFLAVTFRSGAGPGEIVNIYKGTLSAAASEATYGTATDGSGVVGDDSAKEYTVGNTDPTGGTSFQGRIAYTAYIAAELSLQQIIAQQFDPRVISTTRLACHLGYAGTGTQPDMSGNGNSGTVSGPTVADHVPIISPFGARRGLYSPYVVAPAPAARAGDLLLLGVGA